MWIRLTYLAEAGPLCNTCRPRLAWNHIGCPLGATTRTESYHDLVTYFHPSPMYHLSLAFWSVIPGRFICHRTAAIRAVIWPGRKTTLFQSYFMQLNKHWAEKGKELLIIFPRVDKDLLSLGWSDFYFKGSLRSILPCEKFWWNKPEHFVLWFMQIIGMFFVCVISSVKVISISQQDTITTVHPSSD